jgi:hypothetical protein
VELAALVPDVGELALDVVTEAYFVAVGVRPTDEFVVAAPFELGDVVGRRHRLGELAFAVVAVACDLAEGVADGDEVASWRIGVMGGVTEGVGGAEASTQKVVVEAPDATVGLLNRGEVAFAIPLGSGDASGWVVDRGEEASGVALVAGEVSERVTCPEEVSSAVAFEDGLAAGWIDDACGQAELVSVDSCLSLQRINEGGDSAPTVAFVGGGGTDSVGEAGEVAVGSVGGLERTGALVPLVDEAEFVALEAGGLGAVGDGGEAVVAELEEAVVDAPARGEAVVEVLGLVDEADVRFGGVGAPALAASAVGPVLEVEAEAVAVGVFGEPSAALFVFVPGGVESVGVGGALEQAVVCRGGR